MNGRCMNQIRLLIQGLDSSVNQEGKMGEDKGEIRMEEYVGGMEQWRKSVSKQWREQGKDSKRVQIKEKGRKEEKIEWKREPEKKEGKK